MDLLQISLSARTGWTLRRRCGAGNSMRETDEQLVLFRQGSSTNRNGTDRTRLCSILPSAIARANRRFARIDRLSRQCHSLLRLSVSSRAHLLVSHSLIKIDFSALQIPADAWLRLNLFHCSITHLVFTSDGRVSCFGLGDVGHIPQDRRSYV